MKKVLCHGVFDVLHAGHLAYFQAAKKFGGHLTVSVTADKYVNKGPGRPYFSAGQRAEMVKALGVVDEVIISDSPTAVMVIEQVKPDYYCKGPDYKDLQKDVTGEIYNEKEAVEKHGGKLVFTEEETFSSSTLINKFFQGWSDEQRATIDLVNSLGGIDAIESSLRLLAEKRVLVIGEPILDVYRFVNPEGISSKSPSLSARFISEEIYHGGSLAIKNHLETFVKSVVLESPPGMMPKKIRYISGTQRIFEVTEIEDNWWAIRPDDYFCDKIIEQEKKADIVILADFGHGLFERRVLETISDFTKFTGLNVQTNSSNFGYNVYHKHDRWSYLCQDARELKLGFNLRHASPVQMAKQLSHVRGGAVCATLGPEGSALIFDGYKYTSPAFADNVVDATGAGDAYFAITTCLLATGCKPELVPFIGNVFAGLKTKIIGNKSSVTKAMLLKACAGILK